MRNILIILIVLFFQTINNKSKAQTSFENITSDFEVSNLTVNKFIKHKYASGDEKIAYHIAGEVKNLSGKTITNCSMIVRIVLNFGGDDLYLGTGYLKTNGFSPEISNSNPFRNNEVRKFKYLVLDSGIPLIYKEYPIEKATLKLRISAKDPIKYYIVDFIKYNGEATIDISENWESFITTGTK